MEATFDPAEEHLSQSLQEVVVEEDVLTRPRVGERTSAPVRWNAKSFAALDEAGVQELGLL